jgi:hypothetical protein
MLNAVLATLFILFLVALNHPATQAQLSPTTLD